MERKTSETTNRVTVRDVMNWSEVIHIDKMSETYVYTAIVNENDVDAVVEKLESGNADVRVVYESRLFDTRVRIEFEEAFCPF